MNKEELFGQLEKKGIKLEECKEEYEKHKVWFKERLTEGTPDAEIKERALKRTRIFYKKKLSSKEQEYEGLVYAIRRTTDYGASNQYDEALKHKDEDLEKAFEENYIDRDGDPIFWKGADFKRGKKIDLDMETKTPISICIKHPDKENVYIDSTLTVGSAFDLKKIPLYSIVKFLAVKGKNSSSDSYDLYATPATKLEILKEDMNFKNLAPKLLPKKFCKSVDELREWHEDNEDGFNTQVIFEGNVVKLYDYRPKSYSIEIEADESFDDDEAENLRCWIGKSLYGMEVAEFTDGAMFVAATRVKEQDGEEVFEVNIEGMWIPPEFRVEKTEEEIVAEEKIEEIIVEPKKEEPKKEKPVAADVGDW